MKNIPFAFQVSGALPFGIRLRSRIRIRSSDSPLGRLPEFLKFFGYRLFSRGLKLSVIAALFVPTGCAEYHKRILEETPICGDEFTKKLAKDYEGLGTIEQDIMYDEYSANYYYIKAIHARQGYWVAPTRLEKWDIEHDKIAELAQARERLMRALNNGAASVTPKAAAHAQSHFDCWVEQQAEGWQKSDIAWCRSEFLKAMKVIEKKLGGAQR